MTIGTATGTLIEQLLIRYKHPEHGYRSCLDLLSLAKRYGRDRLEGASAMALSLQACHYRTVRDILANGRDQIVGDSQANWMSPRTRIPARRALLPLNPRQGIDILTQQTIAQLHSLKLLGIATALQRQIEQPAANDLSFEERLALLVQHECDRRHERRCARLMAQAKLRYPQAAMEDFDSRTGRGLERARFMSLALGDWNTTGSTVILTGATGCGKTWLACALAQYAAGTYTRWLAQLAKTEVVVLDDWGLVGLDAITREALMELLDDRAAVGRATLVTSQLPVEHWHAWIGDPALADAMLDRLLA